MDIKHEYDHFGLHRINVDGIPGAWTLYEHVARYDVEDKVILASSPYYTDGKSLVVIGKKIDIDATEANICDFTGRKGGRCSHRSVLDEEQIKLLEANGIIVD